MQRALLFFTAYASYRRELVLRDRIAISSKRKIGEGTVSCYDEGFVVEAKLFLD